MSIYPILSKKSRLNVNKRLKIYGDTDSKEIEEILEYEGEITDLKYHLKDAYSFLLNKKIDPSHLECDFHQEATGFFVVKNEPIYLECYIVGEDNSWMVLFVENQIGTRFFSL